MFYAIKNEVKKIKTFKKINNYYKWEILDFTLCHVNVKILNR